MTLLSDRKQTSLWVPLPGPAHLRPGRAGHRGQDETPRSRSGQDWGLCAVSFGVGWPASALLLTAKRICPARWIRVTGLGGVKQCLGVPLGAPQGSILGAKRHTHKEA